MAGIAQAVLKRVAALVVATSLTGAALSRIPEEIVESLLDPEELAEFADGDRIRLLRLVASDPRPGVRRILAARIAEISFDGGEPVTALLFQLARDSDPAVRRILAASLGTVCPTLSMLRRSELVLSLAASENVDVRFVAASALSWPFELLGANTAISHLVDDASTEVREAARRAARVRQIAVG
jgi:hypothetical protein